MARGRKRKTGPRTKSGRLSTAGIPRIDRGNDRAAAMQARYGSNGSDAIGRCYERGLMGSGQDANAMLDTARAIFRAYWAWYSVGPVRCSLADRNGAMVEMDQEREDRQEAWLLQMLTIADGHDRNARGSRALFDQLVIDINPDDGPPWLNRLIERKPMSTDWDRLACALDTLADCAGVERLTAKRSA
jgi:hypothetical protein